MRPELLGARVMSGWACAPPPRAAALHLAWRCRPGSLAASTCGTPPAKRWRGPIPGRPPRLSAAARLTLALPAEGSPRSGCEDTPCRAHSAQGTAGGRQATHSGPVGHSSPHPSSHLDGRGVLVPQPGGQHGAIRRPKGQHWGALCANPFSHVLKERPGWHGTGQARTRMRQACCMCKARGATGGADAQPEAQPACCASGTLKTGLPAFKSRRKGVARPWRRHMHVSLTHASMSFT